MDNKDLIRGGGRDWILDDVIPEDKTDKNGTPVKLKPLNLRQVLFVKEFCKSFDTAGSAKMVGVAANTAREWLKKDHIRRAIQINVQKKIKDSEMDAQWVLGNTREIVERCMDENNFMPQHALNALKLLGPQFGVFIEKREIDINQKTVIRIESNVEMPAIDITECQSIP